MHFRRNALWVAALTLWSACGGAGPSGEDGGGSGGGAGGGSADDAGAQVAPGGACADATECASGFCVDGVCCASTCEGGCTACVMAKTGRPDGECAPVPDGQLCRPPQGDCDVSETCAAGECPANQFKPDSTTCRASKGTCDVAERCTGVSPMCPADALAPTSVVCRAETGACDRAEHCTGSSTECPADALADAGATCRSAAGVCDAVEVCTGTADCPADVKHPATRVCRVDAGSCDVVETCDGVANDCPSDVVVAAEVVCRPAAGPCDVEESCTGASGYCPGDALRPATDLCRAAVDLCDAPDHCSGSSPFCGIDEKVAMGTVCRPSAGPCDLADVCSGASNTCPSALAALGFDAGCAFLCSGTAPTCPTSCSRDAECPDDTFCLADGGCVGGRRAFVSPTTMTGKASIFAADGLCRAAATAAKFRGGYNSWTSDSLNSAQARLVRSALPYRLPDGTKIADDFTDLADGTLDAPFNQLPDGGLVTGQTLWTGANSNGSRALPNCGEWLVDDAGTSGVVGNPALLDGGWTNAGSSPCNTSHAVYCLQQL